LSGMERTHLLDRLAFIVSAFGAHDSWFMVEGGGFMIFGLGFIVQVWGLGLSASGMRDSELEIGVQVSGVWVLGLGFRVLGSGSRV
jgi:hypothetical protein